MVAYFKVDTKIKLQGFSMQMLHTRECTDHFHAQLLLEVECRGRVGVGCLNDTQSKVGGGSRTKSF